MSKRVRSESTSKNLPAPKIRRSRRLAGRVSENTPAESSSTGNATAGPPPFETQPAGPPPSEIQPAGPSSPPTATKRVRSESTSKNVPAPKKRRSRRSEPIAENAPAESSSSGNGAAGPSSSEIPPAGPSLPEALMPGVSETVSKDVPTGKKRKGALPGVPIPKDAKDAVLLQTLSSSKLKKITRNAHRFAFGVMESAPVFQIPTSLEQLAKRPKKTTPEVLEQVAQMKDQSPQVLTGCWVDENREILAVYFGRGERPKLHEGGGESEGDAKDKSPRKHHSHAPRKEKLDQESDVGDAKDKPRRKHLTRAQRRGRREEKAKGDRQADAEGESPSKTRTRAQRREKPAQEGDPEEADRKGKSVPKPSNSARKRKTPEELSERITLPTLLPPKPLSEQYVGRTLKDLDYSTREHHGLGDQDLKVVEIASQFLHSQLPPKYHPRDARHIGNSSVMEYLANQGPEPSPGEGGNSGAPAQRPLNPTVLGHLELEAIQERADVAGNPGEEEAGGPETQNEEGEVMLELQMLGENGETVVKEERTGVTHLVHAWYPQAHKDRMVPSADMFRSCAGAMATRTYFLSTRKVAARLAGYFQAAFPRYYKKYRKAFAAGVWEDADPGPWIGRAIVWKLQVGAHRDGLDEGPAACFPCGRYRGGELCLPDLNAKLQYKPGDVIIFMAGALYHSVTPWVPLPAEKTDLCTPGRIGHVFFFPQKSYDTLEDKPAGWSKTTNGGLVAI